MLRVGVTSLMMKMMAHLLARLFLKLVATAVAVILKL